MKDDMIIKGAVRCAVFCMAKAQLHTHVFIFISANLGTYITEVSTNTTQQSKRLHAFHQVLWI